MTTWADAVNACWEMVGTLLVLNHCRAVLRDREVAGVSIVSTAAFSGWGLWNLYYYPSLGQWASLLGSVGMGAANLMYVALLVRFRR